MTIDKIVKQTDVDWKMSAEVISIAPLFNFHIHNKINNVRSTQKIEKLLMLLL